MPRRGSAHENVAPRKKFDGWEGFWLATEIMDTKLISYNEARTKIRDGDVLLFRRRRGFWGKLIATAGRSPYSHAAMAAWWGDRLMCLETAQGLGGRAVLLSTLVEAAPGRIDVFRALPALRRFKRRAAVEAMLDVTGRRYGWRSLLKASLMHLPVARLLALPDTDDRANGSLPFCSQAVARACRLGGLDPAPNLADRLTEPGDLARSAALEYRFTLGPNPKTPDPADQEVA